MQLFRAILICGLLGLFAAGCKNTYQQKISDSPAMSAPLRSTNRVYVAIPEDAIDKKDSVPESGRRTAVAIQEAFKRHARSVVTARMPETLSEALTHARDLNCDYLAYSIIQKWEDRPTEWNAVRDKLELKIDVILVPTGEVVRTTEIKAKSKFMTDGEDAPQDLLRDPVDKFVRSLFRMTYTPTALQK